MASVIPTVPNQFFDANGDPLSLGLVYAFDAGTTTPRTTWADAAEAVPNSHPIVLDAAGRATIFWRGTYKIEVRTAAGALVTTIDGVTDHKSLTDALRTDLATSNNVSKGDALVAVKRTTSGAIATTQHAWHEAQRFNAKADFGVVGDGVADDTAAIQAAINAVGANSEIYFPAGTYKITSTITISNQRVHIVGAGAHATKFYFVPSANDTLLEFTAGANVLFQGSLRNLLLYSDSSAHTKIAIDLVDTSGYLLENIVIGGELVVPGKGSFWGGTNSIGLRVRGREFGMVRNLYCYADRPLLIAANPNGSISIDHFHFCDCYLTANANPNVEIDTGVNLTQVTFDGAQAWVSGTTGLRWVDTTTAAVSNGLSLRNVRVENGTSTAAYCIDIQHNTQLQNLSVGNCYFEGGRNGIRLRKCVDAVIFESYYVGAAGRTSLDVASPVDRFELRDMFWQAGSTASILGLTRLWSTSHPSATLPPSNAVYSASGPSGNVVLSAALGGETLTLANDGTGQAAPANSMGMLFVQDSEGLGAIFYLRGANNAVDEVADPATVFSAAAGTAASTNVYWSGANNRYEIQNKRGASRNYRFTLIGSYASAF